LTKANISLTAKQEKAWPQQRTRSAGGRRCGGTRPAAYDFPVSTVSRSRLRLISSRQNTLVKELRRAFAQTRRGPAATANSHCAVEGLRAIEEAIRSGLRFRAVFFSQSAQEIAERLLPQIGSQVEAVMLPDDVFAGAVATEAPQGVAALVKLKSFTLDQLLSVARPLLVATVGLQDPGNLGTVLRSAEAFGAHGVLLGEGTVSRFNPKVVRASAGSMFRLPLVDVSLAQTIPRLRERGVKLAGSSSHRGVGLDQADLSGPLALFIGGEGAGLPRHLLSEMDEVLTIPHASKVESLNAAIAAAIFLYEIARQRNSSDKQ